jgi:hypothetical protein
MMIALPEWLTRLAKLTTPNAERRVGVIEAAAEMVAQLKEFPPRTFTEKSLTEIADEFETFPSVAKLRKSLFRIRDAQLANARIGKGDETDILTAIDRAWFDYYQRERPLRVETEERLGDRLGMIDPSQRPLALLASLVRRQSPQAWRLISGSAGAFVAPTEEDCERVRESAAAAIAALHPAFLPASKMPISEQMTVLRGQSSPKSKPVDPGVLEAARAANPSIAQARAAAVEKRSPAADW